MKLKRFILRRVNISAILAFALVMALGVSTTSFVLAQTDSSQFSQTINAGTLATQIRSDSTTEVTTPNVNMSAKTFSFNCQSGGSASTGTFGSSTERIYVDNPDAADNGWTLTIAASVSTATWSDGGSNTFDFNDAGSSGCTDGADTDSVAGQMTIDPSGGSTTTDYSGSSTTGISMGSSDTFEEGTGNTITLVTAADTSADIWRGYFTGFSISQTIPAETPAASYTIDLTLTVTAS